MEFRVRFWFRSFPILVPVVPVVPVVSFRLFRVLVHVICYEQMMRRTDLTITCERKKSYW